MIYQLGWRKDCHHDNLPQPIWEPNRCRSVLLAWSRRSLWGHGSEVVNDGCKGDDDARLSVVPPRVLRTMLWWRQFFIVLYYLFQFCETTRLQYDWPKVLRWLVKLWVSQFLFLFCAAMASIEICSLNGTRCKVRSNLLVPKEQKPDSFLNGTWTLFRKKDFDGHCVSRICASVFANLHFPPRDFKNATHNSQLRN